MINEPFDNPHYGRDIDLASLETIEIEIDGNLIVPQAFIVRGERRIASDDPERAAKIIAATVDLVITLKAWLAIQMPVYDWRQVPEVQVDQLFSQHQHVVHFTGRGRLDIPVRVADHRLLMIELP